MKKLNKSDLGLNFSSMPDEQRTFMEKMADMIVDIVNKATEGSMTAEEVESKMKSVNEKIQSYDADKFSEMVKDNETLTATVKELTETLEKLQSKGCNVNAFASKLDEEISAMLDSEKFQQFAEGKSRTANGFALKSVSMTGNEVPANANYTGTILISNQLPNVETAARDKMSHVRDFAVVIQGDPEYPMLAWQQIYDVDKNARYTSENGTLAESSFKIKEEQSSVKRVGTHIRMSKRMLKSRVYVRSFILNMVAQAVLDAEDFGILFGDGSGDNLKGITAYDGVKSVEDIIGTSVATVAQGSFDSIVSATNGCVITLKAPIDLLREGMKITLLGFTTSGLNATFDVIKVNDRQLFLEGASMVTADNTGIASVSATINHGAWKSVTSPNSIDALETAIAVMSFAQFSPTVLILNPITLNSIRTEKATDGNRLKIVEDMNGNPIIGGLRVIKSTSVPAGKYFIGDMRNGAQIVEYTGLSLDWADDVDSKLKNQIVLMAQEELIVPVYCPWAFTYGNISALKTAISKS